VSNALLRLGFWSDHTHDRSELLEPEKVKGQPLCMASYKYLFNATRVPTAPADIPLAYERDLNHIVVLRNNRYFKVEVAGRGKAEIAEALREVKKLADGKEGEGLGILTSEDRDVWTEVSESDIYTQAAADRSLRPGDTSFRCHQATLEPCRRSSPPSSSSASMMVRLLRQKTNGRGRIGPEGWTVRQSDTVVTDGSTSTS
jgi:hypothetical protein